jgi:hypothetical protein
MRWNGKRPFALSGLHDTVPEVDSTVLSVLYRLRNLELYRLANMGFCPVENPTQSTLFE